MADIRVTVNKVGGMSKSYTVSPGSSLCMILDKAGVDTRGCKINMGGRTMDGSEIDGVCVDETMTIMVTPKVEGGDSTVG